MPESNVLFASPMSCATDDSLKNQLNVACKKFGLDFQWLKKEGAVFSNADELFETLDQIASSNSSRLANTLVLVDVDHLGKAFSPSDNGSNWHTRESPPRAGVAVELLLRYPQVFFVFLSDQITNHSISGCWENDSGPAICPSEGYCKLCQDLMYTNGTNAEQDSHLVEVRALSRLWRKTHFFSFDDTAGIEEILNRFSLGFRVWFDPTGLRTVVRDRFLGTVFESNENRQNTSPQRDILKERLSHMAIAIDEEHEFAVINAYSAYRHGCRAWITTHFADFNNPLWTFQKDDESIKVTIFRDIDLKFPDIPTDQPGIRRDLRDVTNKLWSNKIGSKWRVRTVSGESEVRPVHRFNAGLGSDIGQRKTSSGDLCFFGHQKPLVSIFDLCQSLATNRSEAERSPLSLLTAVHTDTVGGHGAPYLNLAIAEHMLRQARQYKDSPVVNILGALLAGEAYSLLLGMSKTTALEALLQMHVSEVKAEIAFPGVADQVNVVPRRRDIEHTLDNLYAHPEGKSSSTSLIGRKVKSIFLSQFWADLRKVFRDGERFEAAEYANRAGLAFSFRASCERLPSLTSRLIPPIGYHIARYFIWMGTRLRGWSISALSLVVLIAFFYYRMQLPTKGSDCASFWYILQQTILSSLGLSLIEPLESLAKSSTSGGLVAIFHMGSSYVLFGLLISMLTRKLTRT